MIIYVCSRFRSKEPEKFMEYLIYTCEVSREIVMQGHEVIVPHLLYPNFLDDKIEEERKIGIKCSLKLMHVSNIMIINSKYGISEGMKEEIKHAKEHNITTYTANDMLELKKVLKRIKKT